MLLVIVLLSLSLVLLVAGMIWTLSLRGKTTTRSGREVGAEMMAEKMDRRTRLDGRTTLGRKTWFWGKGWAVEREVSFSYAEIKEMWRGRAFGLLLPVVMAGCGMLGLLLFGGLLMFLTLPSRIPGLIVIAAGLYAAWLIFNGIRRA
jgi:hypothetical protein